MADGGDMETGAVLGEKYGRLTTVKRWPFKYRSVKWQKRQWTGNAMWLVVCECGNQFSIPEGRLLSPPYPEVQACDDCQPHVRLPAVPQAHTRHLGHALVDELLRTMEPMDALAEYQRLTAKPVVPTPAQRRALRMLAEPDLGLRPSEKVLGALERRGWVEGGRLTPEGLRIALEA